ncbi:MAG: hypothetical protein ACLP36_17425 [Acidimicrobiales bacterium]|jgi:hypothetical protein
MIAVDVKSSKGTGWAEQSPDGAPKRDEQRRATMTTIVDVARAAGVSTERFPGCSTIIPQ